MSDSNEDKEFLIISNDRVEKKLRYDQLIEELQKCIEQKYSEEERKKLKEQHNNEWEDFKKIKPQDLMNYILCIEEALSLIYENDLKLFNYNKKNYERSLAFRLAHYLANIIEKEKRFGKDIHVDNEYERHIESPKGCFCGCIDCTLKENCFVWKKKKKKEARKEKETEETSLEKNIRPDIIVHERRSDNNLFSIEVKSPNDNKLPEDADIYDTAKLVYLTCPNAVLKYNYHMGAAINLVEKEAEIYIIIYGKKRFSIKVTRNN